jgi:hypothetical protein
VLLCSLGWPLCLAQYRLAVAEVEEQPAAAAEADSPRVPAGPLPWEARPRPAEPVLRPPSGPLELLERFDIGPSQIESFFSGQPLTPSEEDVLVKVLFRLPRLGLENLERWRRDEVTWDELAAAPRDYRLEVFHVAGRVTRVEQHDLLPEQSDLYEFDHYYRVTLELADSPHQALLLARSVPGAWPLDELMDEPAAADALFLKTGDATAERPPLIFAAGRVAWHPDRPQPEHGIGPPQIALARLGVDAGQWEIVRDANARPLGGADREAFYQLLAAVSHPEARELVADGPQPLDLVSILQQPLEHLGEAFTVRGTARRIMRVPVGDADIQARFGIDHYYEIDLFLPLGDKSIHFGKDRTGEKNPVYHNNFPATLIVRRLPPGLEEGENLRESIRADAVFLKIWTYRSNYAARFGQMQPAPLFIALEPAVEAPPPVANWVTTALVGAALALAVGVIAIVGWWYRGSDQPAEAARKQADANPDFSGLK